VPNEKMADLMNDSFALAQQHITVDQALRETTEGHVLVVLDPDASPQGILTQDMLEDMERTRHLADLLDQCAMPTLTSGETRISTVLIGMASDPAIRWHIVMTGTHIVGMVAPSILLARFAAAQQAGEPWASDRLVAAFQPGGQVFGPPYAPEPNLCYCCQQRPPHCVGPEKIQSRTPSGRARCPYDGSLTIVKNPCA
jgi:hypothetical protein